MCRDAKTEFNYKPAVCKSLVAGHRPSEQASSNPTLTLTTFDVPGLLPHRTSHCPSKAANRPWTALMTWCSHCAVCNAMKDSQGTACPRASSSEVCTILTRLFLIFGCHKISCYRSVGITSVGDTVLLPEANLTTPPVCRKTLLSAERMEQTSLLQVLARRRCSLESFNCQHCLWLTPCQ